MFNSGYTLSKQKTLLSKQSQHIQQLQADEWKQHMPWYVKKYKAEWTVWVDEDIAEQAQERWAVNPMVF